ncbi:MAG: N-acetylmuramoyl-L-alanine amidase [Vicinamibacterales bacterium]
MRSFGRVLLALALLGCAWPQVVHAQASRAEKLYADVRGMEELLRRDISARKLGAPPLPLVRRARILAGTYEEIARLYPASASSDDALWRGATLSADTFWEFGEGTDRSSALRLFSALANRYESSPLNKDARAQTTRLSAAAPPGDAVTQLAPAPTSSLTTLRAVRRELLPDTLRVTLELEHEAAFEDERIEVPSRISIDLENTRAADTLKDVTLAYADDVVREVHVGSQPEGRTRVVLNLQGAARHSVYSLYNPYRVVIDVERLAAFTTKAPKAIAPSVPDGPTASGSRGERAPTPPSTNRNGGFSLSRQLGLGVARIVIDPGHGGHDPGAQVKGLSEADLVLDVALRLEKLLLNQPGVEVVLTRRTNEFLALEERVAMANREEADLFLSIHANASADAKARGVGTYFLNFASNPQAEAIAARENAGSSRTMRSLPDIVKAIALDNKIDESRDFATFVQAAMVERLRKANRTIRSLGVRQAPFMVLIGATMPSILAEIAFITNRQEASLLKTPAYRQHIAEGLFAGVMKYQRSLKATRVAAQ